MSKLAKMFYEEVSKIYAEKHGIEQKEALALCLNDLVAKGDFKEAAIVKEVLCELAEKKEGGYK